MKQHSVIMSDVAGYYVI